MFTTLRAHTGLDATSTDLAALGANSLLPPDTAYGLDSLTQSHLLHASSGMAAYDIADLSLAPPPHGDTLGTATNIGLLIATSSTTGSYNASGSISSSGDPNDFFRFTLGNTSNVTITLTGLTADADLELIRDADIDGVVDTGEVIRGSYAGGSTTESISLQGLGAGSYYARVKSYGTATTNYNLSLSGTVGSGVASESNNTLSTAFNLNTLNGTRTFTGFVGSTDTQDFYRFSLGTTTNLGVTLYGLGADADLEIIRDGNHNGTIDTGEVLKGSYSGSTTNEFISLAGLGTGDYFVRVNRYGSADTNYSLYFSGDPGTGYASGSDNTLNGATDLGTLNGSRTYNGWVGTSDVSDFFRFYLGTSSNVNLSLTGLTADADIDLIRDANYNGVIDSGEVIRYSHNGGTANEEIDFRNLGAGTYFVRVDPWGTANTSYTLNLRGLAPSVSSSVYDAAGDSSYYSVFQGGALRFNYSLSSSEAVANVRLEAVRSGSSVATLGTWTSSSLSNGLINLNSFGSMTAGDYELRTIVRTHSGHEFIGDTQSMRVQAWAETGGTYRAETFNYTAGLGTGAVFLGRGGTDTLNLGVARSAISSINGLSLTSFNPLTNSTNNQAIFRGSAFDYVTLSDGRELYFQGIENLRFSDGSTFELQVRTNDTHFGQQWNLHVSDVDSAWRFTQGASNVMLVSLDTGILTQAGASGGITDISTGRLITDSTDDDGFRDYGHGHSAISVMASTANNSSGVAGINWNSSVYVADVYNGVNLQRAITDAIAYARANNKRVVFQGGIQGEGWLTSGGTRAALESLIAANSDIAVFAVAAGNGGPGGNLSDPNYLTSVSGVAKLQTTHSNVLSVGALASTGSTTVNGLTNASSADIASYSNRGSNLTLMAATNSPAMDKFGNMRYFGGTSCANPNMAGIASLVWSVNSSLNGGQIRQILIDTAMDLGAAGDDNTFGNGLVNADAAVRRATALARRNDLASLYSGSAILA